MDTLPSEMIFEIVKHLDGDEMLKFSMVNKEMYDMFENERKKIYQQRAIEFNEMQFDLIRMYDKYSDMYGEELADIYEKMYIRCLSCFRKISFYDYENENDNEICDECMKHEAEIDDGVNV